jgi:hypothetical protein
MPPTDRDHVDPRPPAPAGKPPDRSQRFLARLDAHLPTIANAATRRAFLDQQIGGWEHRYARFIATDGASEPVIDPADPPQAADFLLTIMGLAARRDALGNHRRTKNMPATNDCKSLDYKPLDRKPRDHKQIGHKEIDSAMLSLLVAADQRCPAIIGQAHVLYHARFGATSELSTSTFAQLKRDAAGLFQAIADVEAAMKDVRPELR